MNGVDFSDVSPVHHANVQQDTPQGMMGLVESGKTMLQQRTQYCTAVQVVFPRQLKRVLEMVLSEVELDPGACYYSWEVNDRHSLTGKKEIIGPTIGLEMSIARNFGNCAIDIEVQEQPDSYIFIPAFLDLESGFTFRRAFRQNRVQDIGKKYDPERAEDMRFQIGQSKAIRNVIRNATPKALTNAAIERARELVRDGISSEGIEKTREKVLMAFKVLNVTIEQLAEYTGISDPAKWNLDILERLITLGKALKNGDITFQEAFPGNPKTPSETGKAEGKKKDKTKPETDSPEEEQRIKDIDQWLLEMVGGDEQEYKAMLKQVSSYEQDGREHFLNKIEELRGKSIRWVNQIHHTTRELYEAWKTLQDNQGKPAVKSKKDDDGLFPANK